MSTLGSVLSVLATISAHATRTRWSRRGRPRAPAAAPPGCDLAKSVMSFANVSRASERGERRAGQRERESARRRRRHLHHALNRADCLRCRGAETVGASSGSIDALGSDTHLAANLGVLAVGVETLADRLGAGGRCVASLTHSRALPRRGRACNAKQTATWCLSVAFSLKRRDLFFDDSGGTAVCDSRKSLFAFVFHQNEEAFRISSASVTERNLVCAATFVIIRHSLQTRDVVHLAKWASFRA